jgi:hypothetical protein
MEVLQLLLDIPADVVAAKILPLLPWRDFVRLDSANLSHRSRLAMGKIRVCAPVSLQLPVSRCFELECAAWEWFWKRSIPIVPSPNKMSLHELAKMVGHEQLIHGNIRVSYWGNVDAMTIERVLCAPALVLKVSHLCVSIHSAQDIILQNLQLFTSLDSLYATIRGAPTEEILLALLEGAAPLKDLTLLDVVRVTDAVLEALMRHVPTMESAGHNPEASTSLNLYAFYAQCRNLHTLTLHCGFDSGTSVSIPIPAASVVAIATGCPKLRTVWLGRLEPGCDALTVFASNCSELQSLNGMNSLRMTNAGLTALTNNCVDFSKLRSASWEVTDASVVHAAHSLLSGLQEILLLGREETDHSDSCCRTLVQALEYMEELRTLALYDYDPDVGLQALLAVKSTQLSDVHFTCKAALSGPLVEDVVVALLARNPIMQRFCFSGNTWLSDKVLSTAAAFCPRLRDIRAQSNTPSALSDAAVVALAQGCPELTVVEGISGLQLTDVAVIALAEHCPRLDTVHLQHSPQVTEAALTVLTQRCRKLRHLRVCASSIDTAAESRIRAAHGGNGSNALSVHAPGRVTTVV